MWKEFKEFVMQGNILDLAIAVVIGAAFGQIISSLVDNIITPIIGIIAGGIDFTSLVITIGEAKIGYGLFIQSIVDFIIIAFAIFFFIRILMKFKGEKEIIEEEEVITQEVLLVEIRDLLKEKNEKQNLTVKKENVNE